MRILKAFLLIQKMVTQLFIHQQEGFSFHPFRRGLHKFSSTKYIGGVYFSSIQKRVTQLFIHQQGKLSFHPLRRGLMQLFIHQQAGFGIVLKLVNGRLCLVTSLRSRMQCPTPWGITLHKTLQNESQGIEFENSPPKTTTPNYPCRSRHLGC